MMNGSRKSDRPRSMTKPANKPVRRWREQVERRVLAKGNRRGKTDRAQDRVSVQSALGRIRQAAVKDKQARFTSLMHHIYDQNICAKPTMGLKRDAARE